MIPCDIRDCARPVADTKANRERYLRFSERLCSSHAYSMEDAPSDEPVGDWESDSEVKEYGDFLEGAILANRCYGWNDEEC